jgi:hypothetical protein
MLYCSCKCTITNYAFCVIWILKAQHSRQLMYIQECIVYRRIYALCHAEKNSTEPCIEYCLCLVHCVSVPIVTAQWRQWLTKPVLHTGLRAPRVLSKKLFPLYNSRQFCNLGLPMGSVAESLPFLTEWWKEFWSIWCEHLDFPARKSRWWMQSDGAKHSTSLPEQPWG